MPSHKSSKGLASKQKSRNAKTSSGTSVAQKQSNKTRQYDIGLSGSGVDLHVYKYSKSQTKSWKPLNKHLKEYVLKLIDSGVKTVRSKPQFSGNQDVHNILSDLKSSLKEEIDELRVPNKKYGNHTKLKNLYEELTVELEEVKTQELLLEKSIRTEERNIEELESLQETVEENVTLDLQIPNDVLAIPRIPT